MRALFNKSVGDSIVRRWTLTHPITFIAIRMTSASTPKTQRIRIIRPFGISERRRLGVVAFQASEARSRVEVRSPAFNTARDTADFAYSFFAHCYSSAHGHSTTQRQVTPEILTATNAPNHALQRTAPVCHACCSPQNPPRSSHASPPLSLSLGSF